MALYGINLTLRFLLEMAALAALAYFGFQFEGEAWQRIALGVGGPLLFLALWGTYIAPRAPRRLPDPPKAILEGVLFVASAAALYLAGVRGFAVLFGLLAAGNLALMFALSQRDR